MKPAVVSPPRRKTPSWPRSAIWPPRRAEPCRDRSGTARPPVAASAQSVVAPSGPSSEPGAVPRMPAFYRLLLLGQSPPEPSGNPLRSLRGGRHRARPLQPAELALVAERARHAPPLPHVTMLPARDGTVNTLAYRVGGRLGCPNLRTRILEDLIRRWLGCSS